ncbi:MAG: FAD-dependent oxidoreductase [Chloroflexota bacterium]
MVVGGGVAGIQAALDLANSGIKVYLIESSTAIGGKMAQLDKTFPTNDCAMCTIAPRLVECSRHRNIEVITGADVLGVTGSVGNFNVSIRKRPRYIRLDKCTGCGECAAKCPIKVRSEYDAELTSRTAIYRRYPQAVPSAFAIDKKGRAPCKAACPAGCSAQGYIALTAEGRYQEAIDLVRRAITFPSVCGRVCPAFCEQECRRAQVEEPLAIASLKRFLADWEASQGGPQVKPAERTRDEKVAIIGAGPAGLTAAADLVRMGYGVTVFEALPVAGGMMRVGIPAYRLPREVLQREIDAIATLGVEIKTGVRVGKDFPFDKLFDDGFKAVFVAAGAHRSQRLGVEGEDAEGVIGGAEFLRQVSLGQRKEIGARVAVIGGGNTAMDAARTALRLGARDVSVIYRRSRAEMPAWDKEVREAEAEGVKMVFLAAPTKVIAEGGRVTAITCIKMQLGEPDSSGRRRPVPIPGSEFTIPIDAVIPAISQSPELDFLPADVARNGDGTLMVDKDSLTTSKPGVFAGGDVASGPATVVEAIAAGHKAASAIDRFIRGELPLAEEKPAPPVVNDPVDAEDMDRVPRQKMPTVPHVAENVKLDVELELGFTEEQARAEASRCLKCGVCSECYVCEQVCQAKAIFHDDQESIEEIRVGSIILAPGYEVFDAAEAGEFGWGRFPNVLTALQFERLLSASGPTGGHVTRPSDHQEPKRIAFLQCVGSRDQKHPYCSSVCCMYATKQSMLAKEHVPGVDCTVFLMDVRSFGKGFDAYFERARRENGVRYIHSRPSMIKEDAASKNLIVRYQTDGEGLKEEEFDLVVLSVGIVPSKRAQELANALGVQLNEYGFCATTKHAPLDTNLDGVFACGPFCEPMDIPDSVTQASGAAAKALEILAPARGQLVTETEYPPERPVEGEPRVGVFICHCGSNIAGVVDVEAVRQYAEGLPNVVYAERNLYTCSKDTQEQIKSRVEEFNINRVVVASCSPRTHEPLFQDTIREVGLNPYLFEMANIRDQCSWVHSRTPVEATEKAKDLIRMAVARAATLQPLYRQNVPVTQSALVIGAGVAGMNAALSLASQGFKVYLVEREAQPGGMARRLRYSASGEDPQEYIRSLIGQVLEDSRIELLTETEVVRSSGFVGNFKTVVSTKGQERTLEHGVIIVATGAKEYRGSEYLLGQDKRVVTQFELEQMVADRPQEVSAAKNVVMIQCVGPEPERSGYCSRICCTVAMKNAIKIKELNPNANVYVLFKDLRTYGFREEYYTKAREKGVWFIRYDEDVKPQAEVSGERLLVSTRDGALGEDIVIPADLLVLSEAVVPNDGNEALSMALKLPLTREGFFLEAHIKLRPIDFSSEGMFVCGSTHYPKFVEESIAQALATAARAATILSKPYLEVGGAVAHVDPKKCAACLTCVRVCPYHVPRINEENVAEIAVAACQGCGTCAGECPGKAIELLHYRDEQVLAKPRALLTGV